MRIPSGKLNRAFPSNRGPPPAGMSMADWHDEVALEEAKQLSLALEASMREAHGLPSQDLIEVFPRKHFQFVFLI